MIVFVSDHEELLRCLYMCTSNALRLTEAKKVFSCAPYQLADPEDLLGGIKEETQTPLTVVSARYKGKIQMLITKKTEDLIEVFLHPYGKGLAQMEDYDRSLIQSPEHNLGLSRTSVCMALWLKSVDGYALVTKIEDEKEEYLRHLADYADIERPATVQAMMRESKVKLPIDVYDQLIMLNDQQEYCPTEKLMALATTINRLHQKATNSSRLAQDVQRVMDLSPGSRSSSENSPSSSSSSSSMRNVVFDAAGALIASFSNVDERLQDMKVEKEEWVSPPSEREEFSSSRRVVLINERETYRFKENYSHQMMIMNLQTIAMKKE